MSNIFADIRNTIAGFANTAAQNIGLAVNQPKQFGQGLKLGFQQFENQVGQNPVARNVINAGVNLTNPIVQKVANPVLANTIAPYANTYVAQPVLRAGSNASKTIQSNQPIQNKAFNLLTGTALPLVGAGFSLTPTQQTQVNNLWDSLVTKAKNTEGI